MWSDKKEEKDGIVGKQEDRLEWVVLGLDRKEGDLLQIWDGLGLM